MPYLKMCSCKAPSLHGHVRVTSDGEGHLQFRIYPVVCSQCKRPYVYIGNGDTLRAGFIDKVKLSYRLRSPDEPPDRELWGKS